MFWVISVYFNIRNTLPKSGTFLLGHPVYITVLIYSCVLTKYSTLYNRNILLRTSLDLFVCKDTRVQDSRVEVSYRGLGYIYICTDVSEESVF